MWARLRISKMNRDHKKLSSIHKSFNVNEEYQSALRTQSFAEFLSKAQLVLVTNPTSSTTTSTQNFTKNLLLEPEQQTVPSILESIIFPKAVQDLKLLILSYFETSAEASRICSNLLTNINQAHSNYHFIKGALEKFNEEDSSIEETKLAISQLVSFTLSDNPFSDPDQHEFKLMHDRYTSILHLLKLKKKKVARRLKLIHGVKTVSGVCLTVACSVLALVAIGIAMHSLSGLLMGPALLAFSPFQLKKKFSNLRLFRSRFLGRLGEQLDAAAKGTYILNRDFDTVSRLVSRLHDEVEHSKGMVRFCLERREDRFPIEEVVNELNKCGRGLEQQIEELEEHVFLCLVTINRARLLVINEISKP
ncbi:hypothetical protein J5N97_021264 [Dioscorea zingiberensis]|uniref:Uncharacterized protein n=1 Tax=Dioscorea zingiberensis TaxID=325984 RepID=A0A9D5HEF6_9LILI|nr:hypothetical protein J5N97_021264 [Dioscorea zingiberensis]